MTNYTTVTQRNDHKPFDEEVYNSAFFCASCDPEANGGHGGFLGHIEDPSDNKKIYERQLDHIRKYTNFCPCCGKRIDWTKIDAHDHYEAK